MATAPIVATIRPLREGFAGLGAAGSPVSGTLDAILDLAVLVVQIALMCVGLAAGAEGVDVVGGPS
jgi:hypothetical protein